MAAVARLTLLGMLALAGPARAGGGTFDGTDADDGRATLFGFVKDRSGDAIDDATVTITMKLLNTELVARSDPQGHYTAKLFYKPVEPKDLAVACAKDGYRQMAVVPRPPLAVGAPIEFDCVLERI